VTPDCQAVQFIAQLPDALLPHTALATFGIRQRSLLGGVRFIVDQTSQFVSELIAFPVHKARP
jgi:hypothetical protein